MKSKRMVESWCCDGGDQPVMVNDEGDGFKQDGILCVRVLNLLGLGRLLGFVEDGLQALCESTS